MKTVIRNGYTPHEDDYCNTLVIDRESDTFYFFDSDGVWTKFEDYGEIQKLSEALDEEIETRAAADLEIWGEIEAIEASSDVVDVVGTYAALQAYDTSTLHANDLIKVLQDETHDDAITYYRWDGTSFTYVGMEGPYYTASEVDTLLAGKQDALTAGTGITIQNGVISATGASYTAGANIQISPENVISATDTTYSAMTGATSSTAGTSGLVPAPAAGDEGKFLQGDGTWATVQSGATYTAGIGIDITGTVISVDTAVVAKVTDIPTKTSNLLNDGSYGTSTYVEANSLAAVATSGSYNDLSNKPTIPAAQVNSDWNAVSGVAQILNKPTLATVATSGSYNDLTDKPTIPVTNNINTTDWNALWQ